jgi:perosamine synthetase
MTDFIPVNEPDLTGNEKQYLCECVDTGWISSEGPFVQRLERDLAARVGRAHGVAMANGSVALDAAVAALRLGPGDEVILPSFTIISCAAAIVRAGATPVVVDSEPVTWNMDVSRLEERMTSRTRAIMAVHIYGLPTDMDPLLDLASRRSLQVIEDAAEAHGLTYKGRPCGGFGDVSAFSFYPNKHVTTGEGGMALTDDQALAARLASLRNLCFRQPRFVHDELGWNFRMSNVQAALGCAQLERLERFVERKRRMGARYRELLAGLDDFIELAPAQTAYAENIYWVFGLVLKERVPFDAAEAMCRLAAAGVGTRPFFFPMHEQPVFRNMGLFAGERLPVSERLARRGFYLPSGLALTDAQMERSAVALRETLAEKG